MNIPEDFRYQSAWEDFRNATDYFIECLRNNSAHLLYGCVKNIFIDIPDENPVYNKIIITEVSSLIEEALDSSYDKHDLENFLKNRYSDNEIHQNDIEDILNIVDKKYQYIVENIIDDEMIKRYFFKENTILSKLSSIKTDINKYIIDNGEEVKYALIKMSVNDKLPNFAYSRQMAGLTDSSGRTLEFVCDMNDLAYLIEQLELIKKKLR